MRSEKFSLVEIVCIAVNVAFFHVYPNKHANPSPGILIVTDVYSLLWQPKTTTNQEKKFSIHFSLIDWMNEQIRDWTKNLTSLFHFFFRLYFFLWFWYKISSEIKKNLLLSPSLSHTLFFFSSVALAIIIIINNNNVVAFTTLLLLLLRVWLLH